MFKLVVLLTLASIAAAKPSLIHGLVPETYSASVVAKSTAVSHQYRSDVVNKPVIAQEVVASPVVQKAVPVATITVPQLAPALAYATVPITGTAYTKNVHYEQSDVVTGYTSQVIKPNLESLATSLEAVSKSQVLAAEAVQSISPTVKLAEPEVTISKVNVPVEPPVVSKIEVRTAEVAQPEVIHSSPALATSYAVNVAPVVSGYSFTPVAASYATNVAPLVSGYSLSAPLGHVAYSSPSIATRYALNSVPAVTTYTATPAVLAARSAVATAEVRQELPLYTEAKLQAW